MNNIKASKLNIVLFAAVVLLAVGTTFSSASIAHADMGYDDTSYGGGFYDDTSFGGGFYDDTSYGGSFYDDTSFGGNFYDDTSFGGGFYDDTSFGGNFYDDTSFGGGFYDDTSFGGSFYDDTSFGGSFYDDTSFGGSFYDDTSFGGAFYDDTSFGGAFYPDNEYAGTFYPDIERTGTFYPDVQSSANFYPDQVTTATTPGASQTVYNPACNCYTPSSYAVDSYTPASYAVDSYTPASYAVSTAPGMASMPFMASASMPFYQQQQPFYPQQQRPPFYPNYPQPSYPYPVPTPSFPQQPSFNNTNVNTTSNYCTGNSCNYTDNSFVNNSINGSFNTANPSTVTTLYPVTAQPIVQYQFPQTIIPTYPTYNQNIYCTITASPTLVQNGQAAYLSWQSNGTSAWLSDGIGYVSANGTLAVRPDGNRTYTLTVYGQGGSNVCSVTINVAGSAPYVSLSQIPYTGFDLGPIGNAMYLMSLAAVAVGSAYFALYYKGGVFAIAGSMIKRPTAHTTSVAQHEAPAHVAPVVHAAAHTSHEMKDMMFITRGKDGTPRIVINRA